MKPLAWYQQKPFSQISFVSAIVGILTAALSIAWNIRVTNEMARKMEKIEENQVKQLIVNEKFITLMTMYK